MVSNSVEKGCWFSRKGITEVESRESLVLKRIEMGRGAQVAWVSWSRRREGREPRRSGKAGMGIRTRGSTFGEDGEDTGGPAAMKTFQLVDSPNLAVEKVKSRREGTTTTQECSRRALTPAASGRSGPLSTRIDKARIIISCSTPNPLGSHGGLSWQPS